MPMEKSHAASVAFAGDGRRIGGAFELAVVVEASRCVALGWQRREEDLWRTGRWARCIRVGVAGIAERCAWGLCHGQIAVDAERGRHVVPSPFQHPARYFRTRACAIRTGDLRHRAPAWTNAKRERPAIDTQRDQTLPAFARSGRPDRRRQAHAAAQIGRQRRNMAEAAEMGVLFRARMCAVDRARHGDFGIARSGRIGVGTTVTDNTESEITSGGARDHEANRIALPDAPAIGIAGQRVHRDQALVTS